MGGTSGRFGVAKIAARLFPIAKPFVQQIIDEGLIPKEEFPFGSYPSDALTRRSDTEVEFVTPGNSEGIGTYSRVAINGQPISGVAIWLPDDDMDLVVLDIRLPPEMHDVSTAIIATVEVNHGAPTPRRPR